MSSWNHRVVKRIYPMDTMYGIHETYYEDDDSVMGITENPTPVVGESVEELRETLERMLKALDEPVLNYDEV